MGLAANGIVLYAGPGSELHIHDSNGKWHIDTMDDTRQDDTRQDDRRSIA